MEEEEEEEAVEGDWRVHVGRLLQLLNGCLEHYRGSRVNGTRCFCSCCCCHLSFKTLILVGGDASRLPPSVCLGSHPSQSACLPPPRPPFHFPLSRCRSWGWGGGGEPAAGSGADDQPQPGGGSECGARSHCRGGGGMGCGVRLPRSAPVRPKSIPSGSGRVEGWRVDRLFFPACMLCSCLSFLRRVAALPLPILQVTAHKLLRCVQEQE